MPEVAEVELVRRGLADAGAAGRPLRALHVLDTAKLEALPERWIGARVADLRRHGKLLGFELSRSDERAVLACHLRMTGALTVHRGPGAIEQARGVPHARAVLDLGNDLAVAFSDVRRFGTLRLEAPQQFAARMGADLLDASDAELHQAAARCARGRRAAKAVMLDQDGPVAGAGNYLCDEGCFAARVHPATPAGELSAERWQRLWQATRRVALQTLQAGGVSMRDYIAPDGSRGEGLGLLVCYGRAGLPCVRCATELEKTVVGGRGTTFCPACQNA